MSIIYEPKGRAREYSPYALNIYMGCSHNCKYCYAPSCIQKKREDYFTSPVPRRNLVENLEKELSKRPKIKEQVLLSFVGDVYCKAQDENETTREVLKVLLKYQVPVAILTKGGERCLRDIDLFKKFGDHIQIGTTLTFKNRADSAEWESGAASPDERLEMLRVLHNSHIRTFASFEPVIVPEQSLKLMEITLNEDCVDVYKIGKINNYKGIDKTINWFDFADKATYLLRVLEKDFYVKEDLRQCAKGMEFYGKEIEADFHNVSWY